MVPVLEAVPNFSSGRDRSFLDRLVRAAEEQGTEVLDASADPDHHRAVLTFAGSPDAVEEASVVLARLAMDSIDLRSHRGVHPRIGALDVLPFVPLSGLTLDDARHVAHRVAIRLAEEVGLPVFLYGAASDPPGRGLGDLRRGGFEAMVDRFPDGRSPDLLPHDWPYPGAHPTAGAVCVGARPIMLAWNVDVDGLDIMEVRSLARRLRERDGGVEGLRAIGLDRGCGRPAQLSMNFEGVESRDPFGVFLDIEREVRGMGGRVVGTEVIGLIPDRLMVAAGGERMGVQDAAPDRLVSSRLAHHLQCRVEREMQRFLDVIEGCESELPEQVVEAVESLERALGRPAARDGTR